MKLKYELLENAIAEGICQKIRMYTKFDSLDELDIDVNEIANTTAIKALSEIQKIVQNDDISDFDAMEQIVCVFEKYKISAGPRHDF